MTGITVRATPLSRAAPSGSVGPKCGWLPVIPSDNADAFAAAGVAVALDSDNLSSEAVAEELDGMLTNEGVRRAAADLADHLAAIPHPNHVPAAIT
jgi:hypothetical protein